MSDPSPDRVNCPYCHTTFPDRDRMITHSIHAHDKNPGSGIAAKVLAIVAILAILAIVGAIILERSGSEPSTRSDNMEAFAVSNADPHLGSAEAPIVIVGFESPFCSGCRSFHENTLPGLERDYLGEDVVFYFQHFDTYSYDPRVRPSERLLSIAQDCVHVHGGNDAFWDFTHEVYGSAFFSIYEDDVIPFTKGFAESAGLDADAITSCIDGRDTEDEVAEDIATAHRVGVRGTPWFYVFGPDGEAEQVRVDGLRDTLDRMLTEQVAA